MTFNQSFEQFDRVCIDVTFVSLQAEGYISDTSDGKLAASVLGHCTFSIIFCLPLIALVSTPRSTPKLKGLKADKPKVGR